MSSTLWHVTSVLNRASIQQHGLDWTRMGAARGIAGSTRPEVDGNYLATERSLVEFFVRLNNTGGPVDVWRVDSVDRADLIEGSSGFAYLPAVVTPDRLRLVRADVPVPPPVRATPSQQSGGAYASTLTITFDDGTVLHDDEARAITTTERPGPA